MRGVALVTGAARRLGRTLALTAAEAGYDLVLHHHNTPADETAEQVRALGRQASLVGGDLRDPATPARLVEAMAALGKPTLLVNNASIFEDDSLETLTDEGLSAHLAINLTAPVLLAQAFAAATDGGQIVNIVDQRVWKPTPQFFSYSLSKAGLWHATQTMAQALAPAIRVNAIGPGPTLANSYQDPGAFQAEAAGTLLGRPVPVEEIGRALAYLIDAEAVTGQMIAVDSGQHLGWRTPDIV